MQISWPLIVGILAAAALVPSAAHADPNVAPEPATKAPATAKLFAIVYEPGPVWKRGMPLAQQNLGEHGQYMRRLAADGVLILAGPLMTSEGGLVILRADDLEAARALMDADPAVQKGQFVGTVSEWRPAIDPAARLKGVLAPQAK
ncbi:YciI family protein [Sphingopyxis solisilvae]|uniref:YciI family protein n=1 Tax=Sphingopyxis solisilvae TaxID=1886788 RepID=UPI001892C0EC|nr:YciI family protein [Sphingopyxis solisilvae]